MKVDDVGRHNVYLVPKETRTSYVPDIADAADTLVRMSRAEVKYFITSATLGLRQPRDVDLSPRTNGDGQVVYVKNSHRWENLN